jgi:hypothetical protein
VSMFFLLFSDSNGEDAIEVELYLATPEDVAFLDLLNEQVGEELECLGAFPLVLLACLLFFFSSLQLTRSVHLLIECCAIRFVGRH